MNGYQEKRLTDRQRDRHTDNGNLIAPFVLGGPNILIEFWMKFG